MHNLCPFYDDGYGIRIVLVVMLFHKGSRAKHQCLRAMGIAGISLGAIPVGLANDLCGGSFLSLASGSRLTRKQPEDVAPVPFY